MKLFISVDMEGDVLSGVSSLNTSFDGGADCSFIAQLLRVDFFRCAGLDVCENLRFRDIFTAYGNRCRVLLVSLFLRCVVNLN